MMVNIRREGSSIGRAGDTPDLQNNVFAIETAK